MTHFSLETVNLSRGQLLVHLHKLKSDFFGLGVCDISEGSEVACVGTAGVDDVFSGEGMILSRKVVSSLEFVFK